MNASDILREFLRRGFFRSARTVTQILLYVNRLGFNFTMRELTPVLLYLLRAGLLARERDAYGQYQYFQGAGH